MSNAQPKAVMVGIAQSYEKIAKQAEELAQRDKGSRQERWRPPL
jgi:hypothetical protein